MTRSKPVSQQGRLILLVDDEDDLRVVLSDVLINAGYRVIDAANGRDALKQLGKAQPDAVILDLMLPDIHGLEVCKSMKASAKGYLPVLLLTARADLDSLVDGLVEAGADDYIVKPFRHRELLARLAAGLRVKDIYDVVRRQNELLTDLSITDDLTGLCNRRHLTRTLDDRLEHLRAHPGDLSCALLDIDHFKQVNDANGHLAGDEVLRKFGQILKRSLGPEDICGRWGGDEFLVIFGVADSKPEEPRKAEERVRRWSKEIVAVVSREGNHLMKDGMPSPASKTNSSRLGVSGGAATVLGPDDSLESIKFIMDLDHLLYQAKEGGGDSIVFAKFNAAGRKTEAKARKTSTARRPTVFVLEDDADICAIIRDMLSRQTMDTFIFQKSADMMEQLRSIAPNLILLDMKLSDGDGMEICRDLRTKSELDHTKISFLTAFTSEEVKQKALACGADAFLVKPFTYSKFIEQIQALLGKGMAG